MKTICSIFILFYFQTGFSQFANKDSLISNSVALNEYLLTIKKIDSAFIKNDSVTRMIDSVMNWKFICSYKKGWQEVIGYNSGTSTVKAFRTDFNDIRVLPSGNNIFTTSSLKKMFYLRHSKHMQMLHLYLIFLLIH